jgi:hypothetical protein
MNRKKTILITAIILLNATAATVLYFGYFNRESGVTIPGVDSFGASSADVVAHSREIIKVLPYGTELNFGPLKDRKPLYSTPGTSVGPSGGVVDSDIGLDISQIIRPNN